LAKKIKGLWEKYRTPPFKKGLWENYGEWPNARGFGGGYWPKKNYTLEGDCIPMGTQAEYLPRKGFGGF